jgi:hypothetical protein
MNKPNSLRAAIERAHPQLSASPDLLTVFINDGTVVATGTRTPSFEYRYDCEMIVRDFIGSADEVMIAVIEWARVNQPNLVTNPDQRRDGITFVADILANNAVDLAVTLKLAESVAVGTDEHGQRTVEHIDDSGEHWIE